MVWRTGSVLYPRSYWIQAKFTDSQDISPSNLVLNLHSGSSETVCSFQGSTLTVAFLDFGLSSRFDSHTSSKFWMASEWVGTKEFMAPEVAANNGSDDRPYNILPVDVTQLSDTHVTTYASVHRSTPLVPPFTSSSRPCQTTPLTLV